MSMILLAEFPSPYILLPLQASNLFMFKIISSILNLSILQLKTFPDASLPFCLSPKFITYFLKEEASIIPLEEFPIKNLHKLIHEKYRPELLTPSYLHLAWL
jgi:hypothetical protein